MKIFNSIQRKNSGLICKDCVYFQNDPAIIEAAYPGLSIMSSGFASVRDQDGFCDKHQLYLSARDSCSNYESSNSDCTEEQQVYNRHAK